MQNNITSRKIAKNVSMSVAAQVVSLLTSFALGFVVPKYISELDYSYWQVFVLYVSYVGILHFGLLDGLVLRYSQYDYDELDKPRFRSQFLFMSGTITIIAFVCCVFAYFFMESVSAVILILVAIGMITKNVFTYASYTFQITNRIGKYAILVIVQRAVYAIAVVLMLLVGVDKYYWFCIADLLGDIAGFSVGLLMSKDLYIGKSLTINETIKEARTNISAGINLMIANFASSFVVGGAKMVVQWKWDSLVFGKVAFSFSVTNLFLNFVTAISVVLFPSLKRTEKSRLSSLYVDIRNIASPLLFIVLLAYFPMSAILEIWLPKYTDSLVYLGILLPTIIFSSKVSLLTNNYLKVYRKEKVMLLINVITVIFAMIVFLISAYLLNNLNLLLFLVVVSLMFRSIASEIVVSRIIKINLRKEFVVEFLMTLCFIFVVQKFNLINGMVVYLLAVIVYLVSCRSELKSILAPLFKKRHDG